LIEDVDTEAWESKVLKNYFEGDTQRLKEIPASRKWLVNQFDIGVNYPERLVNDILKRYHPNCATLRRELVACQLMQRENGAYWRIT
jgi:hypothetical protein